MLQNFFKIALFYVLFYSAFQADLQAKEKLPTSAIAKGELTIFRGPRGHKGRHGHKGNHGSRGKKGKQGANGTGGTAGGAGSVGATGPLGATDVFTEGLISGQVSGPGFDGGGSEILTFSTTVFSITGGIPFSGGNTFTIPTDGDYRVSYALSGEFQAVDNQFTVFINGVEATPISRVTLSSPIGTPPFNYTFTFERIYTLTQGDTVQVGMSGGFPPAPTLNAGNFLIIKVG